MHPGIAFVGLWVGWVASWVGTAWWTGRIEKQPGHAAEARHAALLWAGVVLLVVPSNGHLSPLRLWQIGSIEAWICVGLTTLGFAFCWWARIHLGQFWSGDITLKADHRVIDSGPYAIVRHPIYTGILLAVLATAAAKGTVLGLAAMLLLTIGFCMKARMEERWLSQELGAGAYEAYRRRVPMLLPFGPTVY